VHFDYDGNYHLAREFTHAIMAHQRPNEQYSKLTKNQAASVIGFPNHETNQVMNRLLGMVKKSPFTEQSNFAELEAFTESRRDQIVEQVGSPAEVITRRKSIVDRGLADWKIHYELTELNRFTRDKDASLFHLREVVKLHPHNHESYIKLAEYYSSEGKLIEAIDSLKQSLYYTRNDDSKKTQALGWIGTNFMRLNDYEKGKEYLEQVVDGYSDQIGATMRAYGSLIKYSRDNKEYNDFRRYLADVKRYAKGLIEDERVNEFPLLYRRMAQIMTIAGENAEASRWQQMQPENN
jgi:tetratricopeptide (TPR) repeat protein